MSVGALPTKWIQGIEVDFNNPNRLRGRCDLDSIPKVGDVVAALGPNGKYDYIVLLAEVTEVILPQDFAVSHDADYALVVLRKVGDA